MFKTIQIGNKVNRSIVSSGAFCASVNTFIQPPLASDRHLTTICNLAGMMAETDFTLV
ncbi:hypothetical protein [Microbulbifer sp. ANSA005]|uniref:hypothetical protein n=1 Tax=Microbulbifer sp. ANSA005 TaxID=3243362 RepID=UPI004041B0D5